MILLSEWSYRPARVEDHGLPQVAATFLSGKGQTPIVSFESYTVSVETIQPRFCILKKATGDP